MVMKRLLFIAVAWGAVLLPMAAQAQRGVGFHGSSAPRASAPARGAGFGARPGFAGRPMGRFAPAGIRTMPGARFRSPQSRFVGAQGRRTIIPGQRSFVSRSRFGFRNRFHRRDRFFFGNCFNTFGGAFPCENPFLFGLDPFLFGGIGYPGDPFYSDYSSYSQPQPQPVVEQQDNGNRELALQVQELSDEIQAMRDEDRRREERKDSSAKPASQDDGPNATLVFRDGVQLAVKNYAISGDTIWVLDEHNTQKVPLAKLDLPATQRINEQNGVEFRLPKTN